MSTPSPDLSVGFPLAHRHNRELQEGSQGHVQQWTHVQSGIVIAVKVIARTQHIPPEVEILRDLPTDKSIVKYLGYHDHEPSTETVSILFEYCQFGDLYNVRDMSIDMNRHTFSEAFLWSAYSQMMEALAFLHDGVDQQHPMGRDNWKPIVHRDIKIENFMITSLGHKEDWSGLVLKLGDFGMAGYYDPADPNPLGYVGTTHFWPPEVTLETKRLTPASDVWGVAAIIHELAHNFGPLVNPALMEENWFLNNDQAPYPDDWPEHIRSNYWAAKAPRRVVPINLDPGAAVASLSDPELGGEYKRALANRAYRPSPRYSDALNHCMMAGLAMSPDVRLESWRLLRLIEDKYADFLFQGLRLEHENEAVLEQTEGDAELVD